MFVTIKVNRRARALLSTQISETLKSHFIWCLLQKGKNQKASGGAKTKTEKTESSDFERKTF